MLDLAKILQFIEDRFDQEISTQNGFFELDAKYRLHVFLESGDELKILPGHDIPLISKQLAEQPLGEVGHGLTSSTLSEVSWKRIGYP